MKKSLILGTAVAAALVSGPVLADLSGNAAISSNYIYRGVTQTNDAAAGSGGIDWSSDSGLYAGTWVSNVDFGAGPGSNGGDYEMDFYAGFAGEAGSIGYDVGIVTYQYPLSPNINFTELYASGTISMFTAGVALTVDNGSANDGARYAEDDLYVSGSFDYEVSGKDVSVYVGSYMFDNDGAVGVGDADYINYGASLSKDDFTFAIDKNDIDGGNADNVRVTVSWGKEFEL